MKTSNSSNPISLHCLKPVLLALAFAPLFAEAGELVATDAAPDDLFGLSTSLSTGNSLVGANGYVYLFRNLSNAAGEVSEDARLVAQFLNPNFGAATSFSGSLGLIGTRYGTDNVAYVFQHLDTATGTVSEAAKLIASNRLRYDQFGRTVSLGGTMGLVGAPGHTLYRSDVRGAAYLYRNLNSATGTVTENVRLVNSDVGAQSSFASSVSLSGNSGLVGASGEEQGVSGFAGAAYLFRHLDTAVGVVTEDVKLVSRIASSPGEDFGAAVSLSGNIGLVGEPGDNVDGNFSQGSAYVFRELDRATRLITENVKLKASHPFRGAFFGLSVALEGDLFVIGAPYASGAVLSSGLAYTGSASAMTTLDASQTSKVISGLSFISREDWVVGLGSDGNRVTLRPGDSAQVLAAGKAVYIGRNAGSDGNTLIAAGSLSANSVYIGTVAGNVNNTLQIEGTAKIAAAFLRLASHNRLLIAGNASVARNFLLAQPLQVFQAGTWTTITARDYGSLLSISESGGYTIIEPAT